MPLGYTSGMPLVLPFVLILACLLAACGQGGGDGSEPSTTATATPVPSATPVREATPTGSADAGRGPVRTEGDEPEVDVLTSGLEVPWDIAFLPDGRALVTERPGRIRLVDAQGDLQEQPVARVEVEAQGEGGLMGIDLDPEFRAGEPFVYTMVTAGGEVRVLRFRWRDGDLTDRTVILDGIRAGDIHDSGRLRFGPDDRLYVVTGDAGDADLAQQPGSLNGRILALEPEQYRGDKAAEPEVISKGHRNPQGLDWQPGSGRLFATEHGPSGFDGPSCCDELNLVREGGDYGWPRYGDDQRGSAQPAYLWQDTIAPSGMAFVSQPDSSWTGDILVAALRGKALHRMQVDGSQVSEAGVLLDDRFGRLRAVVEAPDGAIWVTTSNLDTYGERTSPQDDRIIRVVPPAGEAG